MTRRRLGSSHLVCMMLIVAAVLLAGCAGGLDEEGEPLTVEQSEQLAACRYRLGVAGLFTATVAYGSDEDVDRMVAILTVDPAAGEAWGVVSRGPLAIAVEEQVQLAHTQVAVLRDGAWLTVPDAALQQLLIVFSMVSDRPENASLLRQSEARFLGSSALDGEAHAVYRLPAPEGEGSPSRLWLDENGDIGRLDAGDETFVVLVQPGGGERPEQGPLAEDMIDGG